ncbi:MAG: Uma2 family endonuclease [Cyanothece sp. SIO2G6]|nr:Uma2 family endonuclease [Cyanothece sp. SIO2G6]
MIAVSSRHTMSPQEYLAWEAAQPTKYEYLNGAAYAMTGGTLPHNDIAVNLVTLLRNHLRGTGCKVRMADAKVAVSQVGPFFYPDIVVSCDERDRRALDMIRYPCLIVEVLSPSTEGFDRGEKFRQYRRLPSLTEYVLVSAEQMMIEIFRLNAQGKWELTPYSIDAAMDTETKIAPTDLRVQLTSVDYEGAIAQIYEDVELSQ